MPVRQLANKTERAVSARYIRDAVSAQQDGRLDASVVTGLQRLHRQHQLFYKRRREEGWAVFYALVGVIIMCWNTEHLPIKQQHHTDSPASSAFKTMISVTTALLLFYITKRYLTRVDELIIIGRLPPTITLLSAPRLLRYYCLEMLACCFHIPPGIDFTFQMPDEEHLEYHYHVDALAMLMFLRAYLLVRLIRNYSGYYSQNLSYVCRAQGIDLQDIWFHFKLMFRDRPIALLGTFTLVLMAGLTFSVEMAERSANEDLDDYWSSLWMAMVTVSTIGYGDRSPATVLGRIFVTIGGIVGGMLLLALITTVFLMKVELERNEQVVLHYHTYKRWSQEIHKWAVIAIQRAWRCHIGLWELADAIKLYNATDRVKTLRMREPPQEWYGGGPDTELHDMVDRIGAEVTSALAGQSRLLAHMQGGLEHVSSSVERLCLLRPPRGHNNRGDSKRRGRGRGRETEGDASLSSRGAVVGLQKAVRHIDDRQMRMSSSLREQRKSIQNMHLACQDLAGRLNSLGLAKAGVTKSL